MKEEKVLINKIEVNFKTAGEGIPVLILHGWGGSSNSWKKIQENLAYRGYKAICPDLPGFGKSQAPKEAWSVSDYMGWVIELTNYLELNEFHLIAHSFGGRIAVKLANKYPEKIKSLILCSPAGIKTKIDAKDGAIKALAGFGNSIFDSKYLKDFKSSARNFFYLFLKRRDYTKAKGMMRETMKKVLEENLFDYLEKINKKTLIVWGERDKLVPIRQAHIFKQKIKNSELAILPKMGHSPHLEAPEELSKVIFQFLA